MIDVRAAANAADLQGDHHRFTLCVACKDRATGIAVGDVALDGTGTGIGSGIQSRRSGNFGEGTAFVATISFQAETITLAGALGTTMKEGLSLIFWGAALLLIPTILGMNEALVQFIVPIVVT